jgi:hypothetical protein
MRTFSVVDWLLQIAIFPLSQDFRGLLMCAGVVLRVVVVVVVVVVAVAAAVVIVVV